MLHRARRDRGPRWRAGTCRGLRVRHGQGAERTRSRRDHAQDESRPAARAAL